MSNVPDSARDDYDERTPSERGYDDGYDNEPKWQSANPAWGYLQDSEYEEAFERGLEAKSDDYTFGANQDWEY